MDGCRCTACKLFKSKTMHMQGQGQVGRSEQSASNYRLVSCDVWAQIRTISKQQQNLPVECIAGARKFSVNRCLKHCNHMPCCNRMHAMCHAECQLWPTDLKSVAHLLVDYAFGQ